MSHPVCVRRFAYAPPERVRKALVDAKELSVTAILTYPVPDLNNDLVSPSGLDFSAHALDPVVDLEHDNSLVVARCRKDDEAEYSVRFVPLELEPENRPGVTTTLPVGTSYFDPRSRVSSQAFALVERGALPGVSLEFTPVPGCYKARGTDPLNVPRPPGLSRGTAYEFSAARVTRYTHCASPVCPGALVAEGGTVRKSLPAELEPLASVLSAGRIGGDPLHPSLVRTLQKSLSAFQPSRVTVRVEKAMDQDTEYDAASPDATDTDAAEGPPPVNGIAALYAKAQALLDACEQNEQDMEASDSPELRAFAAKMCEKVRAIAEEIKEKADDHDKALNQKPEGEEGGDDDGDEDDEEAPESGDMETDEEGMLKAVRPVYRPILKSLRVRRVNLSEIRKAEADPLAGLSPKDLAELTKAVKTLNRKITYL